MSKLLVSRLLLAGVVLAGVAGGLTGATAVASGSAIGPALGDVYFTDGPDPALGYSHRVMRMPSDGGAAEPVVEGLAGASGVALDSAGNVYYSQADHVAEVFADGSGSRSLMTNPYSTITPEGLFVTGGDEIFAADNHSARVVRVSGDLPPQTVAQGDLSSPLDVAVDTAGNVYVASLYRHDVVKIPADGGARTTLGSHLEPWAVTVDTTGNVYVADAGGGSGAGQVLKFPADGGPFTPLGDFDWASGLALDAVGNLYVADKHNARIVRIDADGDEQTVVLNSDVSVSDVAVYAPPPVLQDETPPNSAEYGVPFTYRYSYTAMARGGEPAPRFRVTDGILPPGLTLDPTGVLTGTPTTAGTFTFRVQVGNVATADVSPHATITVPKASQTVDFTSTPPSSPHVRDTYTPAATSGSGGAVTFSVAPGSTAVCSMSPDHNTVRFESGGTCVVRADQDGTANYVPAQSVSQTIDVIPVANPVLGASTFSTGSRSRYGWYSHLVTVRFACTPGVRRS